MATTYFGFAVADGMFPGDCTVSRATLTVEQVKNSLKGAEAGLRNGTILIPEDAWDNVIEGEVVPGEETDDIEIEETS
jgi:hypothetical protein